MDFSTTNYSVLIVTPAFPNRRGGVSDYSFLLSRALVERKWQVGVFTSKGITPRPSSGARIFPCASSWGLNSFRQIRKAATATGSRLILIQYVPYGFHALGVPIGFSIAVFLLRLEGFRVVTTVHELAIRYELRRPKYWIVGLLQRVAGHIICLSSFRIIASSTLWQHMLWIHKARLKVIPIGSNLPVARRSMSERRATREKHHIPPCFLVCTFGGANAQRRTDILIRAIEVVSRRLGGVGLLVLGGEGDPNGFRPSRIDEMVRELGLKRFVKVTGYQSERTVARLLACSDVFVFPDSDAYGGLSTKSGSIAAAMQAGLPIVGRRGALTDNFFKHGKNAYILKSLTIVQIAGGLVRLMKSPGLRRSLSKGSLETFSKRLSWNCIAESYDRTLHEAVLQ